MAWIQDFVESVGNTAVEVVDGAGDFFTASADNSAATAKMNAAMVDLVKARAQSEKMRAETMSKAALWLVGGLLAILALVVFSKYILPKLVK